MAEEKPAAAAEEVVVVADVPEPEKPEPVYGEKELPPAPEPEPETVPEKPAEPAAEEEKPKAEEKEEKQEKTIVKSYSFKEETNVVDELPESQKKALDELKALVQEALSKQEFTLPPPKEEEKVPVVAVEEVKKEEEEVKVVEEKASEPTEEVPQPEATPAAAEETPKPEPEAPAPPPVEEKETPAVVEAAVVEEVAEKVTEVDDDGAKTVEAIKETIVEVSASAAEPESPPKPADEGEAGAETKKGEEAAASALPPPPPEEIYIWGIPLIGHEKSDVILLKFLRARDFKVKEAFAMIKNTVLWRKEFGIEALLEEELGSELDKVVFVHGFSKKGHPVCYNVFGEFKDKELYHKTFSDEEKRKKFLKWRIQFLEKSIRKLDLSPTGVSTIVQVHDFKNSPGLLKRELKMATSHAFNVLQDNYPEFLAKQLFINVPWWYLAFNKVISPFFTQRTRSKFVIAGPSRSAEALFKYIAPEQVPVQYGGLSREGEQEFTTSDPAIEVVIKPASKHTVEFPISESGHLVWEVRVVGWEVNYGAEFVPSEGYTVIVQKSRKVAVADETVIFNSFRAGEPGKVVLTIDNQSNKKKKLLYRSKTKPLSD